MASGRVDLYNRKTSSATIDDGKQKYETKNRKEWKEVETSAFTYRVGVVYFPMPELSFYGSISSYFNPVTTTYSPTVMYLDRKGNEFNPDEDGGEVFKPEKGYSTEVGVRYTINEMVDINASVFYIRKYNIVKSLGDTTVLVDGVATEKSIRGQVGRADSRGFDIEVVVRPLSTLQLREVSVGRTIVYGRLPRADVSLNIRNRIKMFVPRVFLVQPFMLMRII